MNPGSASRKSIEKRDGLVISGPSARVIPMLPREPVAEIRDVRNESGRLDWLAQPLSPRGLARTVDGLALIAASLLFGLIFLVITRDVPPWPFGLTAGWVVLMAIPYWGFFWLFGGMSLGKRLARQIGSVDVEKETE